MPITPPPSSTTPGTAKGVQATPPLPQHLSGKSHWSYLTPTTSVLHPGVVFVSFKNENLFGDPNRDKSSLKAILPNEIKYLAGDPKSKIVFYLPQSYWNNNTEERDLATESIRYLHDELGKGGGKLVLVITDTTPRNTAIGAGFNAAATGDEAAKIALGLAQVQIGGGLGSSGSSFQVANVSSSPGKKTP